MSESGSSNESPNLSSSKRKRTPDPEISIDLSLPEPVSKKARRLAKKASTQKQLVKNEPPNPELGASSTAVPSDAPAAATQKRSDFGIWIGNLPFSATKETLREFLKREGGIEDTEVVRVHLPTTNATSRTSGTNGADQGKRNKSQNKGFAYIDFTTSDVLGQALQLSERLFAGRRVLIKDAKSFEGRPVKEPKASDQREAGPKEQPSRRIFVGNLGFDVTKDELAEHFSRAGRVEDLFLATFEDSGKCKGFAWVTFETLEGAEAAVRGFVFEESEEFDDAETDEVSQSVKKKKQRGKKHYVNRLHGRQLRCEFAEDAQTRYKKRFGKDRPKSGPVSDSGNMMNGMNGDMHIPDDQPPVLDAVKLDRKRKQDGEQRREDRRKRHEKINSRQDKQRVVPQRASGAIVAGAGRKVTFDE